MGHGLGRRPLPEGDTKHLQKYPFRAATPIEVERTLKLPYRYRPKYDQGTEGACVGFSLSWQTSILNGSFYDAMWLYREAQKIDEWPGEGYDGTSVRAGLDVLKAQGHRLQHDHRHAHGVEPVHGIERFEWTTTVDGIRASIAGGVPVVIGVDWMSSFWLPEKVGNEFWIGRHDLGRPVGGHAICVYAASDRRQAVKLVNTWGREYPLVWIPYDTMQTLLNGISWPGEAAIVTDRLGGGVRTEKGDAL